MKKERPSSHCRLCDALAPPRLGQERRVCDTVLFRSPNFVLLPAIGPLVLGHVMLVAREHVPSLAAMSSQLQQEYDEILSYYRQILNGNILEAEHGGTTRSSGGGCIIHTHINILPGISHLGDVFKRDLPRLASSFSNAPGLHANPYLFTRGSPDGGAIYDATDVPSQEIRRRICTRLKSDEWDWRIFPRYDLIEESVHYWKRLLGDEKAT